MIDKISTDRNRVINGILIAVTFILLLASIYSVYLAWRTGLAQSRAETASRLMAIRTSPRSTETPGINAWVSWSLLNRNLEGEVANAEAMNSLVMPRSGSQFPVAFRPLLRSLRLGKPKENGDVQLISAAKTDDGQALPPLEFRNVDFVKNRQQTFVLTSRKNERVVAGLENFAEHASSHLLKIANQWNEQPELPAFNELNRIRSARVARFYVLNEDESLLSLPLADQQQGRAPDRETISKLQRSERDEFRKNPLSPSFVSNNFFFNFEFGEPLSEQAIFSGLYLDLGGLGLVASVITPVVYDGQPCVIGADIAFDVDWEQFAQHLSTNLISHVTHVKNVDRDGWNPWSEFLKELPSEKSELRQALRKQAEDLTLSDESAVRKSVYLAKTRGEGDLMAIQVDRSTWLLLLVAANEIKLPWTLLLLTSALFFGFLMRVEQSRRKAVHAQRIARGEMQEKQNLLETMKVPLMVVDPNTDQIVFCNGAAQAIGMSTGEFFGQDVVAQDGESQDHYRRTQTLGEQHRRAYGVRLKDHTTKNVAAESSYAIVRSVAVTAPIDSLQADERHRLGILFLVDEDKDLSLLLKAKLADARIDEKRRLSGLMNHGVDSLARILRNKMRTHEQGPKDGFELWLSNYLSDRIQLVAWVLENWGELPSTAEQTIIERETVKETIDNLNTVFEETANDRSLREQLHWNNGVVAGVKTEHPSSFVELRLDWNSNICFSVPREGVFGFMLSEILINAVRHGVPGKPILVAVTVNEVRNEIEFSVSNAVRDMGLPAERRRKAYGGLMIVSELARLCDWRPPKTEVDNDGCFVVSWSVPAIRRKTLVSGD